MGGGTRTPLVLGSTGRRHPKPKALEVKASTWERKESADTKEYESCLQNDMEVDEEEGMEDLTFVPSAVEMARTPQNRVHVRSKVQQRRLQVL